MTFTTIRFLKFSFCFAAAHGWYGISFPSTMPWPPGAAPHAPMISGRGPGCAACARMSQFAVVKDCQIPFRLGLPSGVRGAL